MEPGEIERRVHNLANAMNRIRSAQADRDDVIVEMKHSKLSRLELLLDDLKSVAEDIPKDNEQFEFSLVKGDTPRLWIDMTTFVRMAEDGREYEFVKDTRMGRVVLGRSSNRRRVGEKVTSYVAERVLERERMIEGEWHSLLNMMEAMKEATSEKKPPPMLTTKLTSKHVTQIEEPELPVKQEGPAKADKQQKNSFVEKLRDNIEHSSTPVKASKLWYFVWFLLGLIGGGLVLFALTWIGLIGKIVESIN